MLPQRNAAVFNFATDIEHPRASSTSVLRAGTVYVPLAVLVKTRRPQ